MIRQKELVEVFLLVLPCDGRLTRLPHERIISIPAYLSALVLFRMFSFKRVLGLEDATPRAMNRQVPGHISSVSTLEANQYLQLKVYR